MGIGIAVGVGIGIALVILCYCQGCYCFGGSTETIVVEEYGTSKGLDVHVVSVILEIRIVRLRFCCAYFQQPSGVLAISSSAKFS